MPPNNSFNPQSTPPAPGSAPNPNPETPPAPAPPMGQPPAAMPGADASAPTPLASDPAPNPFSVPASPQASPFGVVPSDQVPASPLGGQPPVVTPPTMPSQPPKKNNKMLIIIIAVVVLLGLGGFGIWWYMSQNQSSNVVSNGITDSNTADEVEGINTVAWVEPEEVPADYVKTTQSSGGTSILQYASKTNYCTIVAAVVPLVDTKGAAITIQDALESSAKIAEQQGVTTTDSKAGKTFTFADANSKTFTFDSSVLTQKVDVAGVPYTDRVNTVAYKDFNGQMVSISQACPADASDDDKTEMTDLAAKFTLETT